MNKKEMKKAFQNLMEIEDVDEKYKIHDFFFRESIDILYSRDRKEAGVAVELFEDFVEKAHKEGDEEHEDMFDTLATLISLAYEVTNLPEGVENVEKEKIKEETFEREWEKYKDRKF